MRRLECVKIIRERDLVSPTFNSIDPDKTVVMGDGLWLELNGLHRDSRIVPNVII